MTKPSLRPGALSLVVPLAMMSVSFHPPEFGLQTPLPPASPPFMSVVCAYVTDYEQQLAVVVGEEDSAQRVFELNLTGYEVLRSRRRLRSEFALLRLPTDDKRWIGARDVIEVDGRKVADRAGRLTALLRLPFWRRRGSVAGA